MLARPEKHYRHCRAIERVQDEVRQYEEAIRGVVIQLESLERHPYLAFTVENPADSVLWPPPEVLRILQRNKG